MWEGEARQLTLSATQAIAVLEHLRADDSWQLDEIVVRFVQSAMEKTD